MIVRDQAKSLTKFVLGASLVYYVIDSRMIDFGSLQAVIWNPYNLLLSLVFYGLSAVAVSARWHTLMQAQGLPSSLKSTLTLTMIGNFCNTFMPGSVGGDLIKGWFAAGTSPNRKTRALVTVFLDRYIGLCVMVFYALTALLLAGRGLPLAPEMGVIGASLALFLLINLGLSFFFFSPGWWDHLTQNQSVTRVIRFGPFAKIFDAIALYRGDRVTLGKTVLLSGFSMSVICFLWCLQGATLGIALEPKYYFLLVPLVLTASAVPILPRGLGVGQVALFTLFRWMGTANPESGGALCTLMQVHMMLFSCIGAVFYARFKKQVPKLPTEAPAQSEPEKVTQIAA